MAKVKIGNVYPTDEYLLERCAPAGYGLGVKNGHDCIDCNDAILNGTYYIFGEDAVNHPGSNLQYGCMDVKRRGSYITQIVHYDCLEAKRFSKDSGSTWGEWEWVNPPLLQGVEYRTTERYMGQPVYAKLVDCGNMLNAEPKTIAHGCGAVIVVRCHGATNLGTTIPYRWNDYYLDVSADRTNIYICTNADFSTQTCMVKLCYTKN